MKFQEYNRIISDAILDYMNRGGSLYRLPRVQKEYFFEYEKEMSYEEKKKLEDKAIQMIMRKADLPKEIRLVNCIYHDERK